MDRWGVYEALKGNKEVDLRKIENMSPEEAKEGLIEFLLVRNKNIEEN